MSIYGALTTAVSGLKAQSNALSAISDNVANSSTTGYKVTDAAFSDLVTGQETGSTGVYSSGGVNTAIVRNVAQQGTLTTTSSGTDLALDGNGFFVVSPSSKPSATGYGYTRAGDFATDSQGYLVNSSGNYLLGYQVDAFGKALQTDTSRVTDLQPVNVYDVNTTAKATTAVTAKLNLPANAAVGFTGTTAAQIYDSLGVPNNVTMTWTKTASNTWTVAYSNPTSTDTAASTTGTSSGGPYTVTFNSDGTLASTTDSSGNAAAPTLTVSGWADGAATSTVAFNYGTVGGADGVTQYSSSSTTAEINASSITSDGNSFGKFVSVSIDKSGVVSAKYDNGQTRSIYKIPVATFANPDGLAAQSGTSFTETTVSGSYTLNNANDGAAGKIDASTLESSTVDLADEFSRMIVAQQAYTAASKVVTTANEMLTTLSQIIH